MLDANQQTKRMYALLREKDNYPNKLEMAELLEQGKIDWDYIPDDGSDQYMFELALVRTSDMAWEFPHNDSRIAAFKTMCANHWAPDSKRLAEYKKAHASNAEDRRSLAAQHLLKAVCKHKNMDAFTHIVSGLQSLPESIGPNVHNAYHYLLDNEPAIPRHDMKEKWDRLTALGIRVEKALSLRHETEAHPNGTSFIDLVSNTEDHVSGSRNKRKGSEALRRLLAEGLAQISLKPEKNIVVKLPDGHSPEFSPTFFWIAHEVLALREKVLQHDFDVKSLPNLLDDIHDECCKQLHESHWAQRPTRLAKPAGEFTIDDMKAAYGSDSIQYIMHPEVWAGHEAHGLRLMHSLPTRIADQMLEYGHRWMAPAMLIEAQSVLPEGKCTQWSAKLAA